MMIDTVDVLNKRIAHIVKTTDAEIEKLEAENQRLQDLLDQAIDKKIDGYEKAYAKLEAENARLREALEKE